MVLIHQSRNAKLLSAIRIFIILVNSTLIRKLLKMLRFLAIRVSNRPQTINLCALKAGGLYCVTIVQNAKKENQNQQTDKKKKYSTAVFWASIMFLSEFECFSVEHISPVCKGPPLIIYFYSHFLLPFRSINAFEFTFPQSIMRLKSKNIILIITINQ